MSLALARLANGKPANLPGTAPFPCESLRKLANKRFTLPAEDPWVEARGSASHVYLDDAKRAWVDDPEWMDVLDPNSPVWNLKRAERDLYLHHWAPWAGARRVMDVGCGVGRLLMPFLDRGADVWGVDADIESLRRCAWHAAGRPGRLDLHWSSVRRLPEVRELDAIIASEVLCYVPEAAEVIGELVARLRPGGALLLSMEARWGWATAADAPHGAIEAALDGDGIVDVPGDRWVRTWEADELTALLTQAGLRVERMVPLFYTLDGPLEACLPDDLSLENLLGLEARCAAHPVWGKLNRVWATAAVRA